jgi:hypothetical protein
MKPDLIYTAPIISTGFILGFPDLCAANPAELAPLEELEDESPSHALDFPDIEIPRHNTNSQRELRLDFADPLRDFDSNTNVWHSACNLGGELTDFLGRQGLHDNGAGRFLNTTLNLWWNWGMSYVSHEMAHDSVGLNHGVSHPFNFDLSNWGKYLFPKFIQELDGFVTYDPLFLQGEDLELFKSTSRASGLIPITYDEKLIAHSAGMCQNELEAEVAWRRRLLNDNIFFDEGLTHLLPQIATTLYSVSSFAEDGDPANYIKRVGRHESTDVATPTGTYQTINYDIEDFQAYAIFADILSFSTWESVYSVLDYIINGTVTRKPFRFDLGDVDIFPPNFKMLPTTEGIYLDAEIPIGFGDKRMLFANLGSGVDNLGDSGRGNWIRFGAQYHSLRFGHHDGFSADISPFAYLNIDNDGRYLGHAVGFEGSINFGPNFSLLTELAHNDNDMIENIVKYREDGFRFRAGMRVRY